MLKTQEQYVSFLRSLKSELQGLDSLDFSDIDLDSSMLNISNTQLLIPVIGGFSAGKSTLLNSFLGEEILSVAVTPETALATELHYSEQEYIEAVKENGEVTRFERSESENLKHRASEFSFARFYLNKPCLKEIEPLVLVDMPGFESPLASHNKAIFEYIRRGVYFVVLQSAEHGNITASMKRELENILTFERKFSFFLSKSNLKPASELEDIRKFSKQQLEDYFYLSQEVECIGKDGGESLRKIVRALNPNEIIKDLYLSGLQERFSQVKQKINAHITALSQDKAQNAKDIAELKEGLTKLESERDRLISQVNSRYTDNVDRVVSGVNSALNRGLDELAQSFLSGGQAGLESAMNSIVKNALSEQVKSSMEFICNDVVSTFSSQLNSVANTMQRLSISDEMYKALGEKSKDLGSSVAQMFSSGAQSLAKMGGVLGALGSLAVFVLPVVNPLLAAVVALLPGLASMLFGGNAEEKKKEQAKSALLTQVFPQVLGELRTKLPSELQKQAKELIDSLSKDYAEKIKQQLQAVESAQKELEDKKQEIESKIATLKGVVERITALANSALYA